MSQNTLKIKKKCDFRHFVKNSVAIKGNKVATLTPPSHQAWKEL